MRVLPLLLLFPGLAFAQGEDCSSATPIAGTGAFPWSTIGASSDPFFGVGGGFNPCDGNILANVFWAWTPPADGDYVLDVCDSTIQTNLGLFEGGDCTATCIGRYTDGCGNDARVLLPGLLAANTYLIQIGSNFGGSGTGTLVIEAAPAPPVGDTCASPEAIAGLGAFAFDQTFATDSGFNPGGACNPYPGGTPALHQDVFFAWTPGAPGDVRFSVCDHVSDTTIAGFLGDDCTATCIGANNDDGCGVTGTFSLVLKDVQVGQTYLIQVGVDAPFEPTQFGDNVLEVTAAPPPPTFDDCTNPLDLAGFGILTWDNTDATSSAFSGGAVVPPCPVWTDTDAAKKDLFYRWTSPITATMWFNTFGSATHDIIAIYEGSDCSATCVQWNDGVGSTLPPPQNPDSVIAAFEATAGATYLIQLGNDPDEDEVTPGVLEVRPEYDEIGNDTCAGAFPVMTRADGSAHFRSTTIFRTTSNFDGGNPALCFSPANAGAGVLEAVPSDSFHTWTPGVAGTFRISTFGSTNPLSAPVLSVHQGSDCSATCLGASNESDPGAGQFGVHVDVTTTATDTYLLQIGGIGSFGGALFDIMIEPLVDAVEIGCAPAQVHHEGGRATLATSSFGSGIGSGLWLDATDGPADEFAFVLVSATGGGDSLSLFSGVLCLEATIGRYDMQVAANQGLPQLESIGRFGPSGVLQNISGTGTSHGDRGFDVPLELPFTPPGATIQPGDTLYFQVWFRDEVNAPGDSANFSDMVIATFG